MFGYLAAESFRPKKTPETVESFREPNDGTLRYRPWGAMPADPFADEQLKERQRFIDGEFKKLFDAPSEGTPTDFAQMFADDYLIGEERRKLKNFEGYSEWLAQHEPISEQLDAKIDHVVHGDAYIGEILDYAIETSVNNFEIGKVTSPYGERLEYVEPFRCETEEAIIERGGIVYPKIFPYHSLSIVPKFNYFEDGTKTLASFIIRYKRDFGHIVLPDRSGVIHIVERQIAGIRIDAASGFPAVIKYMLENHAKQGEDPWENAEKHIRDCGAEGFIMKAVQADSRELFFEPDSTTIYGYKEIYTEKTKQDMLARIAMRSMGPVEDDGIAYFGPAHSGYILKK